MPPNRLKLRLTKAAETAVRKGHPWVFADRVKSANRPGDTGELAVVYDQADRFLAVGLYDPASSIALRVLHVGSPVQVDEAWWTAHLARTLAIRQPLFGPETDGYRCINGESDGWPGLVLDTYAGHAVLKIYTAAWLPWLPMLQGLIQAALAPASLTLRLSRNVKEQAKIQFKLTEGPLLGSPPQPVIFSENGLRFEADVLRGQKTGCFLDQRENRARVESLANGRQVLNVFSFSGGFSLYAARGGAQRVVDLDISNHALESAQRNFALNRRQPRIAQCQHETLLADAFQWLETGPSRKFDLIICDPPSLAPREEQRLPAAAAYQRLNTAALLRLTRQGILIAASCSAHVSSTEFFAAVRRAVHQCGRRHQELWLTGHAADHPATIPEARYLKCMALQLD